MSLLALDPVTPHVVCVLPTRDRPGFLQQAIRLYFAQDYPSRSLVIVDDSRYPDTALLDGLSDDQRAQVHVLRRTAVERLTRGAKRNQGVALAPADSLIAHWDDDDWMASDRLSRQVRALLDGNADLCGAAGVLHYRPITGRAWRECADSLCTGSLVYRRPLWESVPLSDRSGGEERALVDSVPPARRAILASPSFYVAILHDGNTVGRNVADDARWTEVPPASTVGTLLDRAASAFYTGLRREYRQDAPAVSGASMPPAPAPVPVQSLTVTAPFLVYDGYGSMAEYLVLGLERAGARVHVRPLDLDLDGTTPEFKKIVARSRPEPDAPVLYFCWPRPDLDVHRGARELFVNTMWEGTQLPAGWAQTLNRTRAVLVPSRFVADVCRDSGVTRPIHVIPEGLDPEVYTFEERPERRGLTTLIVGTLVARKNPDEAIEAWKRAFKGDPDARLLIKARFRYRNYVSDDPRIRFVDENESTRGIAHWYRQADVLLALGSEGFGLPLVEGMATGLPVVALNAAGQADTCGSAGPDRLLAVPAARWVPHTTEPFGPGGLRPVPDVDAVAERLRWVAVNQDAARAMGRAASEWARRERSIWDKGPAVLDALEGARGPAPASPLRRVPTLWTPSYRSACGVAEYGGHLAGGLDIPVRHAAAAPDPSAVRLLHVQHEPTLFDDAMLSAAVREFHAHRIPVVVTEHAVLSGPPREWEKDASALVALTSQGADRLRQRLPDQQVHWLPPGCPTYPAPRKRTRGRVVGSFGFLERHKGFFDLLELVRSRRCSELVLFSHAKNAALADEWERAAAGLPARRIGEFLPIAEIVRRLAAEADVLVLWYGDSQYPSASYAARIALATGVPVLTSPTQWFADLRGVTYQPDDLAAGVQRLLDDDDLRARITGAAADYCQQHHWSRIARRHRTLWEQL